jgi:hypothetical protein
MERWRADEQSLAIKEVMKALKQAEIDPSLKQKAKQKILEKGMAAFEDKDEELEFALKQLL